MLKVSTELTSMCRWTHWWDVGRFGALSGPAEPILAQVLRLLSRHGAGISEGSKNTSCYLHVTDSWI